ncbi:MAG: hypothetical protein FWC10_03915 [Lentimicrobiaceae bacterium]|nr:hypothetical protein [Lentimicrobiaceae bacterium]
MHQIMQNIKDGRTFSPKRSNNEFVRNIHYITVSDQKRAIVLDFGKSVVVYKNILKNSK